MSFGVAILISIVLIVYYMYNRKRWANEYDAEQVDPNRLNATQKTTESRLTSSGKQRVAKIND